MDRGEVLRTHATESYHEAASAASLLGPLRVLQWNANCVSVIKTFYGCN